MIRPDRQADERGSFIRTFCEAEFAAHGLPVRFPQCNLSSNIRAGTVRGMHVNVAGHLEAKLVRCVRGTVHDVIVDLRPGSSTHAHWFAVELSGANAAALFIPEGFAHGFMTLEDNSDIYYHMSQPYEPEVGRGFRWDDPAFGIAWPRQPAVVSERDRTYADFDSTLLAG